MTKEKLDLPAYIRRMRIVSAEQVALVMAGTPEYRHIGESSRNPYQITLARNYLEIILQAIDNGEISCKCTWQDYSGNVTGAEFYAEEIWPWVVKEISDPSPWYGADKSLIPDFDQSDIYQQESPTPSISQSSYEHDLVIELKNKINELEQDIKSIKALIPCHIGEFLGGAERDPLYQAIRIRNTEWVNYDPNNDRGTRGNQAAITQMLVDAGFSGPVSKAIEAVACPINRNPSKVA